MNWEFVAKASVFGLLGFIALIILLWLVFDLLMSIEMYQRRKEAKERFPELFKDKNKAEK